MPNRLGKVVAHGCYNDDKKLNSNLYCHNCPNNANNIRWRFEVLDQDDTLIGHVEASLRCKGVNASEGQQRQMLTRLAQAQVPA
ncbi:MAG: hypothetical protein JO323_08890 [Acidobacteriia bacterium]|nr:hypothetical protein [Terriglobia bacterium]